MSQEEDIALVCRYMDDEDLARILLGRAPKKTLAKELRQEVEGNGDESRALRLLARRLDPES